MADSYGADYYVSGQEPGIASDWNFALSKVSTRLATIAHQDDLYLPNYAETAIRMLGKADNPLIFFTNYGEIRGDDFVDNSTLLRVKRALLRPLSHERLWGNMFVRRRIMSMGSAICCPSVTFNLGRLERPLFTSEFKSNLDWQAWERISRMDGSFVYCSELLMRHRIHEGSETTALIKDDTRTQEDLAMLELFWPRPVARLINKLYSTSQTSNSN